MIWDSSDNEILLNPRWPEEDRAFLYQSAQTFLRESALKAHVVIATSGSTADSWRSIKLVALSKQALLTAARNVNEFFGWGDHDIFVRTLPLFHVGGLAVEARAHVASSVPIRLEGDWAPEDFVAKLSQARATVLSLVPTQVHDLVRLQMKAPSSLRGVLVGGAALSPELEKKAKALGWPLIPSYGMTETSAVFAVRSSSGEQNYQVFPSVKVRVGLDSRLEVSCPGLATATSSLSDTGPRWERVGEWYRTEDRAEWNGRELKLLGRSRDQIKILGENVSLAVLREILESQILAVGGRLQDFHLWARPQDRKGFELILLTSAPLEVAEKVRDLFQTRVLPFERIHEIVPLDHLPRTDLGKIRESELLLLLPKIPRED